MCGTPSKAAIDCPSHEHQKGHALQNENYDDDEGYMDDDDGGDGEGIF